MTVKTLARSFAGGEITPELAGRLDLVKYQTGLAVARNFITLPHGPAARRPGLQFIAEARDSTRAVRLIPFAFSATQTAIVEIGHQYMRFYIDGGLLLEASRAISTISGSTVTMATAHGWSTGDDVFIGNRIHRITVTGSTTFTTADRWGAATTASGTTAARVYTLASPYVEADLFGIDYAQSADVITLTHPAYAARELRRVDPTTWTLTTISFAPTLAVPTGLTVTTTVAVSGNQSPQSYVLTHVGSDGVTESLPCAAVTVNNNLSAAGNFNTITYDFPAGNIRRVRVYKRRGGTYGYMGESRIEDGRTVSSATWASGTITINTATAHGLATGDRVNLSGFVPAGMNGAGTATVVTATQFTVPRTGSGTVTTLGTYTWYRPVVDDNIQSDTTIAPPDDFIKLNTGPDDYPAAVAYHEQRRWFAGSNSKPQVFFGTRTGTESNLTSSIPARDDDGLELRVAAGQFNRIRHLAPLADLIAFTAGGEFRIFSDGAPAITPTSVSIKVQGYTGASSVQPIATSGALLYVQAQGSRVRELSYSWESEAYRSIDVSIMAPHRFDGYTLRQLAFSRTPEPVLWAVRNDGVLLGMTYVPEQQVYGWHAHDTVNGAFESAAVVSEANEDALYVVVRRVVNGRTVRYIERLRTRMFATLADAFFVDSGLTYSGSPVTTISGLWHLEGQQVDVLTDGAVHPRCTVTGGAITLDYAASVVHVGLPITADLRTLPLALDSAPAAGQGTAKNVTRVHLRVARSSVVSAGPSFDRLRTYPARVVADPYGSPPALRDGELTIPIDASWNQDGGVCVRQDLPLPLTVLAITMELQAGG